MVRTLGFPLLVLSGDIYPGELALNPGNWYFDFTMALQGPMGVSISCGNEFCVATDGIFVPIRCRDCKPLPLQPLPPVKYYLIFIEIKHLSICS